MAKITGKELEESASSNVTDVISFSYKFKDELKITASKKQREDSDEDDLERNDDTAHQEFMRI
jgi:hypothetical protein